VGLLDPERSGTTFLRNIGK